MIVVIDYKVGNVKSVCNAFEYLDCDVTLTCEPEKIKSASGLVLPGVAAFGFAAGQLGDLSEVVKKVAQAGTPLLGICVGFQLLFDESCELGCHKGLGLISGKVIPIPKGRVIPHMGWNKVQADDGIALLKDLDGERHFYFAHSFFADVTDEEAKVGFTEYDDLMLPACVQKSNIFGTQFHPEKSGPAGLAVLKNFADICKS